MRRLRCLLFLLPLALFATERAIEAEIQVPAPPAEVWQAWTTSEGIRTFFAPDARVELRVDGPFEIFINPLAEPGQRGADGMRILAFQPERMLAFTWNAPPHLPAARAQRTHVVVRLFPAEGGTRVTLHHDGWGEGGEWDQACHYFAQAWPAVLGNLKKRFETGPLDWTEWMAQMRAFMEKQKARPEAAK
jgi:uncharacterized protein YndB with AHSA1/START domain